MTHSSPFLIFQTVAEGIKSKLFEKTRNPYQGNTIGNQDYFTIALKLVGGKTCEEIEARGGIFG